MARVDINEIVDHFYQGQGLPLKFRDLVICRFSLAKCKNSWSCQGEVDLEHGALSVTGHVKGKGEPEMLFSSHIKMTKQPVKELLHSLGLEKEYIEGQLTLEGSFSAKGKDKKGLISSLVGSTNLLVEKGKIKKSHVIFKVLDFLSLQKIFEKRPSDLSKGGFYFETIKGHITVKEGVAETSNLIMKSPVFNAAAKGRVDLTKGRIDFDLGAQPLGTIDFLISNLPIVGYILTGKEKSLVIYYFKIKGPLSRPEVQYVPLKNLGDSFIGLFKRLLLSPGRLFEGISEIIQAQPTVSLPNPLQENL